LGAGAASIVSVDFLRWARRPSAPPSCSGSEKPVRRGSTFAIDPKSEARGAGRIVHVTVTDGSGDTSPVDS
jgi:hypothetical protein